MPISHDWLIPKRVIVVKQFGTISLDDIAESDVVMLEMLAQGQAPVHTITDTSQNVIYPSLLEARHKITHLNSPNLGLSLVGGVGNALLHFLVKILSKMANKPITLHNSVEEALRYLQRQDPSLPDLMSAYREYKQQQTAPSA